MRWSTPFALLLSLATLWGCSTPKLFAPAAVPPRVNLQGYGALGLVEFASNSDTVIGAQTTREFESHIQSAQPGARFIDLGSRESLLAAVGAEQLDARALRRIGRKYGVDAIFVGKLSYSEPKAQSPDSTAAPPDAGAGAELRGDIVYTLMETHSGDSVWRNSASERRPLGRMKVSAQGTRDAANPHQAMVPSLVYRVTEDFRPSVVN
jgi:hypothetical protein